MHQYVRSYSKRVENEDEYLRQLIVKLTGDGFMYLPPINERSADAEHTFISKKTNGGGGTHLMVVTFAFGTFHQVIVRVTSTSLELVQELLGELKKI